VSLMQRLECLVVPLWCELKHYIKFLGRVIWLKSRWLHLIMWRLDFLLWKSMQFHVMGHPDCPITIQRLILNTIKNNYYKSNPLDRNRTVRMHHNVKPRAFCIAPNRYPIMWDEWNYILYILEMYDNFLTKLRKSDEIKEARIVS
jgi:hypothetical protein